ncbi:MAG: sensor histidine kinase [Proteobacteria bacterium]|nr:sensor histidine kinase [Pseudomonadota bacterium]
MHFDDRLGTVLRLRADGPAVRRIQYRQLLDLLGTVPSETRGEQIDSAFARLGELAVTIPAQERAAMVRDDGLRLRSPRLVASLAQDDSLVAGAALDRAELNENQWLDLIPALPIITRGHVRRRHDLGRAVELQLARLGIVERGLPVATQVQAEATTGESFPGAQPHVAAPASTAADDTQPAMAGSAPADPDILPSQSPPPTAGDGIGALVRRIEAYRRARRVIDHQPMVDAPRLPLDEDHLFPAPCALKAFNFATDAAGRIVWTDPGVAPMIVGLALAGINTDTPGSLGEALRRRQPLVAIAATLEGAPGITGSWQIDAAPWFDPLGGRHLGWRGRMRRFGEPSVTAPAEAAIQPESQSDRIRQMLHELRTPVNAIQGFAEVIQQQLFGPTPHEYRALAASIAGDAARMLAAFGELERLAKLESHAIDLEPGETDLGEVVNSTIAQLAAHTRQRGSGFALKSDDSLPPVGLARIEVERIVWRLLATLAGVSAPGEILRLKLQSKRGLVRIDVALPATLATRSEEELFQAAAGAVPQVISAGVFGLGFALRLVAAEIRAAGGALVHKGDRLRLTLPGLTQGAPDHSHTSAGSTGD